MVSFTPTKAKREEEQETFQIVYLSMCKVQNLYSNLCDLTYLKSPFKNLFPLIPKMADIFWERLGTEMDKDIRLDTRSQQLVDYWPMCLQVYHTEKVIKI